MGGSSVGNMTAGGDTQADETLADFHDVPTSAEQLLAAAQGKRLPPVEIPMTHQERLAAARQGKRKPKGRALESLALRGEIVRLRIAGLKQEEIGELCGVSRRTVGNHIERWIMEQTPAPDQADGLRHVMQERLEFMHSTYWNLANGLDRNGERATRTDTGEPRMPDAKAGEMVLKIMDRQAKLMGVDLQPNTTTLLISAESIAAYLGWDDAPQGPLALAPPPGLVVDVPESDVKQVDVEDDGDE